MTLDRIRELELSSSAELTEKEKAQGYHFCPDWDFAVVGPEDPEYACCLCQRNKSDGYPP